MIYLWVICLAIRPGNYWHLHILENTFSIIIQPQYLHPTCRLFGITGYWLSLVEPQPFHNWTTVKFIAPTSIRIVKCNFFCPHCLLSSLFTRVDADRSTDRIVTQRSHWQRLDKSGWIEVGGCATFYFILFKHMIPGGCQQFNLLCQWMDQQGMRSKYSLIKLKRFIQLEEGDIVGEDAGIESLMLEETLNCKSSHHNHFSTPSDI